MQELLEFCASDRQREVISAWIEHGSYRKAAKAVGISKSAVEDHVKRVKAAAARRGWSPDHDMTHTVPDGYRIRGTSTLYDDTGKQRLQWVKTTADQDRQMELMQAAIRALCEDVKPTALKIPRPEQCHEKLMSVYPMGDPHFGMYSWAAETGADFDLKIAEQDLYAAVDYLVDRSPPSARGVLINLGDFFHAENMEGVTTRSGHVLDMDTRFPMMIDIGIRTLRRCIERMLEKHQTVEMINSPGNHDLTMALFMSIAFRNLYESEPRVIVHDAPTMRHYIEHGKVLIGVCHGHQTKDNQLIGIMAAEQSEAWGRTKYRYYYRGHHHHDRREEFNGGIVEQFRSLAAGDAYAVGAGYLSGRDMKCIVHHADYGEQSRFTCGIDVLRS